MKRRHQAEPLNPHAIGDHLMAFAVPFVVGLALGGAVMLGLRAAKLRWTWALWGAPSPSSSGWSTGRSEWP